MATGRALLVGNSDGIGRALTGALLAQGWSVTGLSRSALALPGDYLHEQLDVNDPSYPRTLTELWSARGPFDVVVHCVGVGSGIERHRAGGEDLSGEAHTLRTNLVSLVELVEQLLPSMCAHGRGHLLGLSSIADRLLVPDAPSYVASKAAYTSYLRCTAARLRGTGVAVTNVRFGFVDTKMAKGDVRPLMVSAERAAAVLLRAIRRRPHEVTYPRLAGALARCVRLGQDLATGMRDLLPR
ncbi:MAG: SDR family NAD(P)-dependent oxidoreductase [Planctomycetota bacterium]|nr:SDR family NAD(P)-dependent oxidoreductase [Planctomycetota bacterium]